LSEKLSFAVENIELTEDANNSQFATLKIDAFASGNNRHSLYVSEDTLKRTAKTILEKPIIWEYSPIKDDATTHSKNQIICGFIPKDSPIEFREMKDSRIMMSVIGKLWVRYAGKMIDIFKRDKSKSVSVEMEVLEENETSDFGIPELLSYCYQGITVLGEMVIPAIPNACADLVSFAAKEKEEYRMAYEKEFSNKYYDIDFTIPQSVRKNAQKSLEEHKKNGGNATSVSLAMARFLSKNEKITPEKVRAMAKFFNSKVERDALTLGFFGGNSGAKWSKEIFAKLEEVDNRQLSYFGEDGEVIAFPYDSLKDAPENMKKLDGVPLTLEQVNQIVKVADGIGVTKEKNGYAIAKDQFKKTHKVENGHWVRKEKSNMSDEELVKEDLGKEDMSMNDEEKKLEEEKAKMAAEESEKERMAVEEVEKTKVASDEEEKKKEEQMATDDETKKKEDGEKEEGNPEEKKKDEDNEKKENMSLDANLDVAAMLAILEDETETYKKLVDEHKSGNVNYGSLCSAMYAKMMAVSKKAQEDKDAYMAENDELKKFKADVLGQRFAFEVESTLSDVSDTMPKDKLDDVRKDSENFNLENVDIWKNKVKALAFSYSKEKKLDGINRMALSNSGWLPQKKDTNKYENGWV
jgi:hypothetical protein